MIVRAVIGNCGRALRLQKVNVRVARVSVAYHAQCCKGSGNYPAIGTPYVVYVVYGRCNVVNDVSRTNQQELEIGNTIVK